MSGGPQARTPAKGAAGRHRVRRRAAASSGGGGGVGTSPPAHRRTGPSTPPNGAKRTHGRGGGDGGLNAVQRPSAATARGALASAPHPENRDHAATPLTMSLLTETHPACHASDAEGEKATALSSASMLSPTQAVEGEDACVSDQEDAVQADEERETAITAGEVDAAQLPVTPERPAHVRFFRCARSLLHQGSDSEGVEHQEGEKPAITLGHPRNAAATSGSPLVISPLRPRAAAEEEETEVALRVLDMKTTVLGEEDEEEDAPSSDLVDEKEEETAEMLLPCGDTTSVIAGCAKDEPTAAPEEDVDIAKAERASADTRMTPVFTSKELHPSLTERNRRPSRVGREVSATSSPNASPADSRASIGSFHDTLLRRMDTAAPVSMPRRSASLSDEQPSGNGEKVQLREMEELLPFTSRQDGHADVDAAARGAKPISLSSGRAPSGSYGCTEGMNSPVSHQTRRSTPRIDEMEEMVEGRRSTSPVVIAPLSAGTTTTMMAAAISADSAEVALGNNVDGPSAVILPKTVHVRPRQGAQTPPATRPTAAEEAAQFASNVDVYHARFATSARGAQQRVWKAAIVSLEALTAEYQESLLRTVMRANKAAWLPDQPLTGLRTVNKAAAYTTPVPTKSAKRSAPPAALPAASQDPFLVALAAGVPQTSVSEMRLLFHLFAAAPSDAVRAHLCSSFFAQQLSRYHNWVLHLQFEFLYVRIVATRAISMLEMHDRRLTCMRRDLGVRDKIELFVLLAPRPRAPTLSVERGVISAFRMALHAISGGSGDGSSGQRHSRSGARRSGSSAHHSPPPKQGHLPPATPHFRARRVSSAAPRPSATAAVTTAGPLFASERCRSGKYAVPIVCELTEPLGGVSSQAAPRVASAHPETEAGVAKVFVREVVAPPAEREVMKAADTPLDTDSHHHHRGVPRPINKTYTNYYKRMAEKKKESPSVLAELRLPRLLRTGSRTSSASRGGAPAMPAGRGEDSQSSPQREGGADATKRTATKTKRHMAQEDELWAAWHRLGRRLSSTRRSRSPRRRRDIELPDGHLRANECVSAKPRERTPPTEADFVDLRDDAALRRFLI